MLKYLENQNTGSQQPAAEVFNGFNASYLNDLYNQHNVGYLKSMGNISMNMAKGLGVMCVVAELH